MAEHYRAFRSFLEEHYRPDEKPLQFLTLQRGVYSKSRWQDMASYPVLFGTTITPLAAAKGFNRVTDNSQMRGLLALRDAGCPKNRISIELGPILPDTVDAAVAIAVELARRDIVDFITYRGASIGQYGDYRSAIQDLVSRGFLSREDLERAYTFFDGRQNQRHEYYIVKNLLAPAVETAFVDRVRAQTPGLRLYRHTGHLYPREFGVAVAANRNNRVREEMLQYARTGLDAEEVQKALERFFGYHTPAVEQVAPAVFRVHGFATEDMAMAMGARLQVALLFTAFRNQPTVADVQRLYFRRGWLPPIAAEGE